MVFESSPGTGYGFDLECYRVRWCRHDGETPAAIFNLLMASKGKGASVLGGYRGYRGLSSDTTLRESTTSWRWPEEQAAISKSLSRPHEPTRHENCVSRQRAHHRLLQSLRWIAYCPEVSTQAAFRRRGIERSVKLRPASSDSDLRPRPRSPSQNTCCTVEAEPTPVA